MDNFSYIDHIAPHCTSNEHFKGVLDDSSLANFSGCIRVEPDAQKTEAYQANNNLLLTDSARVNAKPQLIIDADDVKCSHGATVGQIRRGSYVLSAFPGNQFGGSPDDDDVWFCT